MFDDGTQCIDVLLRMCRVSTVEAALRKVGKRSRRNRFICLKDMCIYCKNTLIPSRKSVNLAFVVQQAYFHFSHQFFKCNNPALEILMGH